MWQSGSAPESSTSSVCDTIMEQVDGFDMPFSSTDTQSPRERPAKGGCGITDYSCFYFDVSLVILLVTSLVTSY